jgi:hypothetical protein
VNRPCDPEAFVPPVQHIIGAYLAMGIPPAFTTGQSKAGIGQQSGLPV